MSKSKHTNNKSAQATTDKRPVDVYFEEYSQAHQNPTNKLIHWICVPLIVFSLFGLVWTIPFPHLSFLGKYDGFFNWASFLLAFSIFYYYRLSPMLSYLMLVIMMGFSYLVTLLVEWHNTGGPALWLVCAVIFVLAWIGQFIGHKIEGKKPSFLTDLKFLLIGPIWLLHFVLKKFSIRY